MKDPILKELGLTRGALSADDVDAVVGHLVLFARAGGVMTWDLWRRLGPRTKAAAVLAFERVKAEDAAAIGMASQGPRQAARVMSVADGGELETRLCLDEFVDRLDRRRAAKQRTS